MDQMACSLADESSALFIDTQTLAYERIPIPSTAALLVIDSGVRHSHVGGEYRIRREECARAADALGVNSLRQVGEADLSAIDALPEPLNRRASCMSLEIRRNLRPSETIPFTNSPNENATNQLSQQRSIPAPVREALSYWNETLRSMSTIKTRTVTS